MNKMIKTVLFKGNALGLNNEGYEIIKSEEKVLRKIMKKLKINEKQVAVFESFNQFDAYHYEPYESNIDVILENKQITGLLIYGKNIDSIKRFSLKIVKKLIHLKKLYISYVPVKKIIGLKNLSKLKELTIINAKIRKIENLEKLKELYDINLSYNPILKIENLEKLSKLMYLRLNNTRISKIENLEKNIHIDFLDLENTFI